MLNTIFWIASASDSGKFKSDLLEPSNLPDSVTMSFSDIWISALKSDCILNSPAVAGKFLSLLQHLRFHTETVYRNDDRCNAEQ